MTAPVILCCGEAVMDLVPATLTSGGHGFRPVAGGAAVNSAIALTRRDVPCGFIGALSDDPMGVQLFEHMQTQGVDLTQMTRSPAPTTIALAHIIDGGTRFDLYDEGSAGRGYARADLPQIPDSAQVLVFGGISLIHTPAADAFETLARHSAPDHLIYLDLNIRPGLVSDRNAYRARLSRLIKLADIIKISDEDLEWFGPLPDPQPGSLLLHTKGADGATAIWGETTISLPAPAVEVRDTIGAGDIFNAGFLAALYRQNALGKPLNLSPTTLETALHAGIQAASFSVSHPGAHAPTRQDLTCAP
jgi:fructokinase